tara:strand:+ start:249 stop:833 length:585 start_codon:yes stop_codon:yes gene_type:complete
VKQISSLNAVIQSGKFGDFENKNEKDLLKISELKKLSIFQIAQYRNSNFDISNLKADDLKLPTSLKSSINSNTRILWMGPKNWLVVSSKADLLFKVQELFDEKNFSITDLSHSRTIIELEGNLANEVLKKGCPLDIDNFNEGDCANSIYNGVAITIDFISNNPRKIRIFGLRSFGESLHHSITDGSLEFGYLSN